MYKIKYINCILHRQNSGENGYDAEKSEERDQVLMADILKRILWAQGKRGGFQGRLAETKCEEVGEVCVLGEGNVEAKKQRKTPFNLPADGKNDFGSEKLQI
ncbi:hypothetical protein RUM43_002073 [Polyplax serrata]|uniref:Uncharacterized protein n=1 Tax=Polyplax serrata TaxID=468196 RepID=A0AAN8NYR8_POLSC